MMLDKEPAGGEYSNTLHVLCADRQFINSHSVLLDAMIWPLRIHSSHNIKVAILSSRLHIYFALAVIEAVS